MHLDCNPAGDARACQAHYTFDRKKDSAGYSVTAKKLGGQFVGPSSRTISTTQVFFRLGKELEILTESVDHWAAGL